MIEKLPKISGYVHNINNYFSNPFSSVSVCFVPCPYVYSVFVYLLSLFPFEKDLAKIESSGL